MTNKKGKRTIKRPESKKFELHRKEKTLAHIEEQVTTILKSKENRSYKIRELLKLKMPLEVAKLLHIKPNVVYDEIATMPEAERKAIQKVFVNNRLNIAYNVKALKGKGMSTKQALEKVEKQINGGLVIELAQVYFSIGAYDRAIRIMNRILGNDISNALRKEISDEQSNISKEIRGIKIRQLYAKYPKERKPSYESISKSLNEQESWIVEVLGMERKYVDMEHSL